MTFKIEEYYHYDNLIDYAVVNTQPIEGMLYRIYATERKFPIELDLPECQKLVSQKVITGNFVKGKTILRHNSLLLADILSVMLTDNSGSTQEKLVLQTKQNNI